MKNKLVLILSVLIMISFSGASYAYVKKHHMPAQEITNTSILISVQKRLLADSDVRYQYIALRVTEHVVTLKGTVNTEEQKRKAGIIASHVKGVHWVINKLTVNHQS